MSKQRYFLRGFAGGVEREYYERVTEIKKRHGAARADEMQVLLKRSAALLQPFFAAGAHAGMHVSPCVEGLPFAD